VTDLQEQIDDKAASDLWDARPDWMMLTISAALVMGWVVWIGVIAYRLLVT
jgi:hypothetical protein